MTIQESLSELAKSVKPLPEEFGRLPTFIVGGGVRDAIREDAVAEDIDLMVCEVSPQEMRERGFTEVDNDNGTFGVFLDSEGREVALAREEESTGDGHRDFDVRPVPADVQTREAVERDLIRRDFTVNSMALDVRWTVLHDPHDGLDDLQDRVLRATDSSAFAQDPLRILRGARFAARLDFAIDDTTVGLMRDMADRLTELPQERVRMEMMKTFRQADEPSIFFNTLRQTGALDVVFPELAGLPDGRETFRTMDCMACEHPYDEAAQLTVLGSALGTVNAEPLAKRLRFSNEQKRYMMDGARHTPTMRRIEDADASTVIDMHAETTDPHLLVSLCRCRDDAFPAELAKERLQHAASARINWTGSRLIEEGYKPRNLGGEQFGKLLHKKRVEHMEAKE